MAINIYGGGANTNANGLSFEQETSLEDALVHAGYHIDTVGQVFDNRNIKIALNAPKHELYKRILEPAGINWKQYISKQLLPDEALLNLATKKIYIVEKKFQNSSGSVDEKLQTCDFKKRQYQKLFSQTGVGVEYIYICNDWFQQPCYADVRQYITSVGCQIYFNEIPLWRLGL